MRWVHDTRGRGWLRLRVCIDGHLVFFGPSQLTIFMALWNARGGYVHNDKFIESPYAGRADGGPDDANRVLYVEINNLRKKLAPTRFAIRVREATGYRLERLPAKCSPESGG